jgi:hypothetical protein
MSLAIDLPTIWAFIIAFAVFVYVVMDGFDLGLGILFPLFPAKADRDVIMNSVAPVWDGNETCSDWRPHADFTRRASLPARAAAQGRHRAGSGPFR